MKKHDYGYGNKHPVQRAAVSITQACCQLEAITTTACDHDVSASSWMAYVLANATFARDVSAPEEPRKVMAGVYGNRTSAQNVGKTAISDQSGAKCGARNAENGKDLRTIIDSWPFLSTSVRSKIMDLVRAEEQ